MAAGGVYFHMWNQQSSAKEEEDKDKETADAGATLEEVIQIQILK